MEANLIVTVDVSDVRLKNESARVEIRRRKDKRRGENGRLEVGSKCSGGAVGGMVR